MTAPELSRKEQSTNATEEIKMLCVEKMVGSCGGRREEGHSLPALDELARQSIVDPQLIVLRFYVSSGKLENLMKT